MAIPEYGAAPLAKTFMIVRSLSVVSMLGIIGLTANFVAEIVGMNVNPPQEIVAILAITCIATLYTVLTIPFFYSRANIGLLVMAGFDGGWLLALAVLSVVIGQHLSFLNCMEVNDVSAAADAESAAAYTTALVSNLSQSGIVLMLDSWAGSTSVRCLETKSVWGLCIVSAILFTSSSLILPILWMKARRIAATGGKAGV